MSFMKKVAKIAAPFASLIPGVGPFIGAGLGALGSLGGGGGSKPNITGGGGAGSALPDPNGLMSLFGDSLKKQSGIADTLMGQGTSLINQGTSTMGMPIGYFKDILGGKTDRALAGPIADITAGSERSLQNTAAFSARGGGMASAFANRGPQVGQQIARLRSDSLTGAANSLLGAGSAQLQGGTSLALGGADAMKGTLASILGMRGLDVQKYGIDQNYALGQAGLSQQKWGGLGEGIGNILGILLSPGGLLNKGSSGGSSGGGWGSFKLPPITGKL
jgi:hypothetical protein